MRGSGAAGGGCRRRRRRGGLSRGRGLGRGRGRSRGRHDLPRGEIEPGNVDGADSPLLLPTISAENYIPSSGLFQEQFVGKQCRHLGSTMPPKTAAKGK